MINSIMNIIQKCLKNAIMIVPRKLIKTTKFE